MPLSLWPYIGLFLPFFALLYAESVSVGSFTVSQLWKLPLVGWLIYWLLQRRHRPTPLWAQGYYWLALKSLCNAGMLKNLVSNVQEGIIFLFQPLIYCFCYNACRRQTVERMLLCTVQYLVLTNIPFLFFGWQTRVTGLLYGELEGYCGIFQNQHAMSTIMGICVVVLLRYFRLGLFASWPVRVYNAALLLLAAYAMYLGFARTGWLMCLVGVVVLYLPRDLRLKQWLGIGTVLGGLVVGFAVMMVTNKNFHDRILDINSETNRQKEFGSGRMEFIANAVDLYLSGSCFELAFGQSMDDLKDYEYRKTGMRIYAHNGFATLLATNGALGIVLKLFAMGALLAFVWNRRFCPTFGCALAFWMMNLSYQLTQGGHVFHSDLLYAMTYCLLQYEYEEG